MGTTLSKIIVSTAALIVPTLWGCSGSPSYIMKDNQVYATEYNETSNETSTESSDTTEVSSNEYPIYSFTVRGVGYNSTEITVPARKILKIRFTPNAQDSTVSGTGFSPQYSALGVYIKVGTQEQATALLDINESGSIMNFSNAFTKTCATDDADCRETVKVTVYKPNYDYWCINYGMYCPYTHVYSGHPWNGTLEIQTDDTETLQ